MKVVGGKHCLKSVLIRSFFWSLFSCIRIEYGSLWSKSPYSVGIQESTDQKKTPYLDTFHAVKVEMIVQNRILHEMFTV